MNAEEAVKYANQLVLNNRSAENEANARYAYEFAEEAKNNRLIMEQFRLAAAPIVSVLKSMSKEKGARFAVYDTVELQEPECCCCAARVITNAEDYDKYIGKYPKPKFYRVGIKGSEKKSDKDYDIEISFDMDGFVNVQNYKIEKLYRRSVRCLCLGIPPSYRVRPERIDKDKIQQVVIDALVDMKLYDIPAP
jgi:hypothetical protein